MWPHLVFCLHPKARLNAAELLRPVVAAAAPRLIICHNRPGGDPPPHAKDAAPVGQLEEAADLCWGLDRGLRGRRRLPRGEFDGAGSTSWRLGTEWPQADRAFGPNWVETLWNARLPVRRVRVAMRECLPASAAGWRPGVRVSRS